METVEGSSVTVVTVNVADLLKERGRISLMSFDSEVIRQILNRYEETEQPTSITPLGSAGGFSGAELWRIVSDQGIFCLRRWPQEHPDESRLREIHKVLRQVFDRGVIEVAVPLFDRNMQTVVRHSGMLWELTRWMPGEANFHRAQNSAKLRSALHTLARFHGAAAESAVSKLGIPHGITARLEQIRRLQARDYLIIKQSIRDPSIPMPAAIKNEFAASMESFLAAFPQLAPNIEQLLERANRVSVPLQPCIRDVWHDHVLFTDDRVTGVVDFGSLRDDHVAADISRLLGSLVRDDPDQWRIGLEAYEASKSLSSLDRQLVVTYDHSGIVLSAMNWLQWLFVERRNFDDPLRVANRCAEIAQRLRQLLRNRPLLPF